MFLLRAAFWLTVVLVLLPSGEDTQPATATTEAASIGPVEAVSAASATVSDLSQFCSRQPSACAIGLQAASVIGQRAQAGAKKVIEFLTEQMNSEHTGSIGSARNTPPSQHTLTPHDLAPAWRGPEPRKEASAKRPA